VLHHLSVGGELQQSRVAGALRRSHVWPDADVLPLRLLLQESLYSQFSIMPYSKS